MSSLALLAAYVAIVIVVGPAAVLRMAGVALLLTLVAEDLLLLSQHTHIPQKLESR